MQRYMSADAVHQLLTFNPADFFTCASPSGLDKHATKGQAAVIDVAAKWKILGPMHTMSAVMPIVENSDASIPCLTVANTTLICCTCAKQVSAAAHHFLCGAVGEEEAVLPQLCHHRLLRHFWDLRGLCADRPCAVRPRTAAKRPGSVGVTPSHCPKRLWLLWASYLRWMYLSL